MHPLKQAILKTISYASVFQYPLTQSQIHRYLIEYKSSPIQTAQATTRLYARRQLGYSKPFYYLPQDTKLPQLRNKRCQYYQHKYQYLKSVITPFKYNPNILGIAITGSLAMKNPTHDDDIDLMIITKTHQLWNTRLSLLLRHSKNIRRRQTKFLNNRLCLNLFLDQSALTVPPPKRSLYTAHEVAQVKFIHIRDDIHHQFLTANSWIHPYLPNIPIKSHPMPQNNSASMTNYLSYLAQKLYMTPKRTNETINLHAAFFHPRQTHRHVLESYHQKINRLGVS